MAMVSTMNVVHTTAARNGSVHPTSNAATAAGAERVRRRLSTIFHRPITGIRLLEGLRAAASRRPKIQGRSCQSPRAQRCWRLADTS